MTTTTSDATAPPPEPQPDPAAQADPTAGPQLQRDRYDRVLFGVCAALGRYTGLDPVLFRVILAVLAVFGGAGIALYAVGVLFIPVVGERSRAERLLSRHGRPASRRALAIGLAIALLFVLGDGTRSHALPLLVIAGVAFLIWRSRHPHHPWTRGDWPWPTDPTGGVQQSAPSDVDNPVGMAGADPTAYVAPTRRLQPLARPPRQRSALGRITLSLALLTAGVLAAVGDQQRDATTPRIVAACLLVLGVGLVVGTWRGRARWLIPVGALLALALGPVALAQEPLHHGAGDVTWTVTTASPQSFRHGAGRAELDLRHATPGQQVTAKLGIGRLQIQLPADESTVEIHARVGLGDVRNGALVQGGQSVVRIIQATNDAAPHLVVYAEVGLGELEILHG